MTLTEMRDRLAALRLQVTTLKADRETRYEEWQAANIDLFNTITGAEALLAAADKELRDAAVAQYQADPLHQKKIIPGVEIKEMTRLSYDDAKALEWAKEHGVALKLDAKVFEKVANAERLAWITVTDVPTCTVATDLSKLVALEEKPRVEA